MYKFEENSRVCFLGDSITTRGHVIRRVFEYYRKMGIKLEMYNCGLPGDTAIGGSKRLTETVFCYDPTDVVISFGMNDICSPMYGDGDVTHEVVLERRRLIDTSLIYMRNIANNCVSKGIRVSFLSMNPYDELTESDKPIFYGAAAALREVNDRMKYLSKNYGEDNMVEGFKGFYEVSKKLFKEGKTLIDADRVHPHIGGQELLAQIFLNAQGFDVEIMNDYDEIMKAAEKPFDEWEEKRFELEKAAKKSEFAEWMIYAGIKDREFMLKDMENLLKNGVDDYSRARIKDYLECYENRDADRKALIEHTKNA